MTLLHEMQRRQRQAAPSSPAAPVVGPRLRASVTRHKVQIRNRPHTFRVEVSEGFVRDPAGKLSAAVLTIAYLSGSADEARSRPVIFCYGASPGASSSSLHVRIMESVIGSAMAKRRTSRRRTLPNIEVPLDVVDIVFIDPIGTGFSRAADPRPFYNSRVDAVTMAAVIDNWLGDNDRERSPRYLVGGEMGAPLLLHYSPDLQFDGILIISGEEPQCLPLPSVDARIAIPAQLQPRSARTEVGMWRRIAERAWRQLPAVWRKAPWLRSSGVSEGGPHQSSMVGRYLTQALKFPADDAYVETNNEARSAWVHETAPSLTDILGEATRRNDRLLVRAAPKRTIDGALGRQGCAWGAVAKPMLERSPASHVGAGPPFDAPCRQFLAA